jgi:regulator of replication initiation timing
VEDKIFELMEKMYSDLKGELTGIKQILERKADKTDIVRLENEHGQKLDALFDGYKQTYEKLREHDSRFDDIDNKMDNLYFKVSSHDSMLEVLEGGRSN